MKRKICDYLYKKVSLLYARLRRCSEEAKEIIKETQKIRENDQKMKIVEKKLPDIYETMNMLKDKNVELYKDIFLIKIYKENGLYEKIDEVLCKYELNNNIDKK